MQGAFVLCYTVHNHRGSGEEAGWILTPDTLLARPGALWIFLVDKTNYRLLTATIMKRYLPMPRPARLSCSRVVDDVFF
jgi:hypothetical protein